MNIHYHERGGVVQATRHYLDRFVGHEYNGPAGFGRTKEEAARELVRRENGKHFHRFVRNTLRRIEHEMGVRLGGTEPVKISNCRTVNEWNRRYGRASRVPNRVKVHDTYRPVFHKTPAATRWQIAQAVVGLTTLAVIVVALIELYLDGPL